MCPIFLSCLNLFLGSTGTITTLYWGSRVLHALTRGACVCGYMNGCVCVCVISYTNFEHRGQWLCRRAVVNANKHTQRDIHTDTDRQTHIHTYTHTQREREGEREREIALPTRVSSTRGLMLFLIRFCTYKRISLCVCLYVCVRMCIHICARAANPKVIILSRTVWDEVLQRVIGSVPDRSGRPCFFPSLRIRPASTQAGR